MPKLKDAVDHSTVMKWFQKFCSDCKNQNNLARTDRPKTLDLETLLQATEVNLASSTQRVSGEPGIFQIQYNLLPSWPRLRHLELLNCSSYYQNIAKLLVHSSIKRSWKEDIFQQIVNCELKKRKKMYKWLTVILSWF